MTYGDRDYDEYHYPTPPPEPPGPRKQTSRAWLIVLAGGLAAVLLVGFGTGAYFLIDESSPRSLAPVARPSASQGAPTAPVPAADPEPLTESELFSKTIIDVDGRAYQVQKTQSLTDCKLGTTGELSSGYVKLGCNQLVRATVLSPQKDLVATVGVFNFTDQTTTATAKADTKAALSSGKGSIVGWAVGGSTEVVTAAETYLSWLPVGHYLAYCVLARTDGNKPDPKDPAVQRVLTDMVETYLRTQIKHRAG